ncbi:MAG: cation diffusion facilitator family transporter [Thermodesulfobacteriota bacterium]
MSVERSLSVNKSSEREIKKDNSNLFKNALYLSYFSVGYNLLEGIASLLAGGIAGSIALIGFGLDSFVESLSGGIMIWRFKKHGSNSSQSEEEIESKATRLIVYTLFFLGAYVLYESLKKLYYREIPEPSLFGIIIAIASIIAMPILFYLKNKIGRSIGSRSLIADSKQTLACVLLSVALLIGLGLNYLYKLWWTDPVVGLFIVGFLIREGYKTLKEEKRCC